MSKYEIHFGSGVSSVVNWHALVSGAEGSIAVCARVGIDVEGVYAASDAGET